MHERGVEKREIGRLLGIHEATVRKAIKRFEETRAMKTAQEEVERRLQEAKEMFSILEECRIVEASIEEGME